eukprot:4468655-Pyramimonas_sp.AAC.1
MHSPPRGAHSHRLSPRSSFLDARGSISRSSSHSSSAAASASAPSPLPPLAGAPPKRMHEGLREDSFD